MNTCTRHKRVYADECIECTSDNLAKKIDLALYYLMCVKSNFDLRGEPDEILIKSAMEVLKSGLIGEIDCRKAFGPPDSCEIGDEYLVTIGEQGVSVVKIKGFGL